MSTKVPDSSLPNLAFLHSPAEALIVEDAKNDGSFFRAEELQSIHANGPMPLYHRLYRVLKRRILSGESEYDEVLPTEASMAEVLKVSRITVKRALDNLAAEKMVRRERAKGSFVTYERPPSDTELSLAGVLTNCAELGTRSLVTVLAVEYRRPPTMIAESCFHGLLDGKALYVVRVRRTLEGMPFAFHESWSSGAHDGVSAKDLETRSRMEVMAENGVRVARATQYLNAASATPDVAEKLGLLPDDPVLTLTRHSFDDAGKVVDLLRSQYHPARFRYCASMDEVEVNPAV